MWAGGRLSVPGPHTSHAGAPAAARCEARPRPRHGRGGALLRPGAPERALRLANPPPRPSPRTRVYELFYGTTMYSQNDVDLVRNVSCNTHTCGFYSSVVEAGSITFGSSGAGVLSDDLGKVVGVMSSGDGGPCPRPSDPYGKGSPIYVIGSLGAVSVRPGLTSQPMLASGAGAPGHRNRLPGPVPVHALLRSLGLDSSKPPSPGSAGMGAWLSQPVQPEPGGRGVGGVRGLYTQQAHHHRGKRGARGVPTPRTHLLLCRVRGVGEGFDTLLQGGGSLGLDVPSGKWMAAGPHARRRLPSSALPQASCTPGRRVASGHPWEGATPLEATTHLRLPQRGAP